MTATRGAPDGDTPRVRYRFFVSEPLSRGDATLAGDLAHRIARVLRLEAGETIALFDGSGRAWPATILELKPAAVRIAVGIAQQHAPEPPTMLLAALVRPHRFEWLIEKATELGATVILPVICARSSVRPAEIGKSRLERWRRIAIEASEQCGRVTVPTVEPPITLPRALSRALGRRLIAAEPAHGRSPVMGAVIADIDDASVSLLTGPEGGLTAAEIAAAVATGWQTVSLGPLVLRAETAAIAALAIVVDARVGRRHTD